MTQNEVSAIVKGISAAVFIQIGKSLEQRLEQFGARIDAMEARVANVRDGEPGPAGPPGERGEAGAAGLPGERGLDGANGRDADDTLVLALTKDMETLRNDMTALKFAQADVPTCVERIVSEAVAKSATPVEQFDRFNGFIEPTVKAAVAEAVAQIQPRDGIDGKDGASVTLDDVQPLVKAAVAEQVAQIPVPADGADGKDGASVTLDDVAPLVSAAVEQAVAALPVPKDGAPGKDGERGEPGQSVDMAEVIALVEQAVADIPRPKDGVSVTVDELQPVITAEVTKAVAALPVPKDPVGVLGALIDRDGQLVLTLSDGTVKALGTVVGRDVDMAEVLRMVNAEVALIPRPKDGTNGKDGVDGFGFDDLELVTDERGCFIVFAKGEQRREFRLPVVIYRGLFSPEQKYDKGDGVTWGGSFWIAQDATHGVKPDESVAASRVWRLAIKRGRDGKVGSDGRPGLNGKDGAPGRDGTKAW